ncbi:MAG: hypothetical protein N2510_02510 [Ignavibacteria bacterium]|nr:hypothetical protein [Ignavibacteria bacterium]
MKYFLKILIRINFITLLLLSGERVNAQKYQIDIKTDTIKIPRTKNITIITTRSVPKFILHINGSFNIGAMELTSHNGGFSREDFFLGKNYSARVGYGGNITGKIPLERKGRFWLDITAGFDRFQSDLIAENTQEGRVYYNSFNGGIGAEYNFTATHKVKYLFGANPLISFISGRSELINPDNNRVDVIIKSSMRLGYQVFIGLEYAFDKNIGLNLGMRFTHANLLLKKTEIPVEDPSSTTPTSTLPLNDDSSSEPIQFSGWKQFAYFSGMLGFSYFFGVKEKRYKIP